MKTNDFVGIPWVSGGFDHKGADCWGLVLLASREIFNRDLGKYEGAEYSGRKLARIIQGEVHSPDWKETDKPQPGDVATMKISKFPSHVGIVVSSGRILHSMCAQANGSSVIHDFRTLRRLFKQIKFYRYVDHNNPA